MKLQPNYFNYMLKGTKRIEIRLNDEKRRDIKVGDTIIFLKEPDLKSSFKTKVIKKSEYPSFKELLKSYDNSILADKTVSKEEILTSLEQFYPKEMQAKYGCLAIEVTLLKD